MAKIVNHIFVALIAVELATELKRCLIRYSNPQSYSVQLLTHVQLFVTPWSAAHQAFLSITNSLNLLKLMSIESMMISNHLILCHALLLLPSIFPSIRVFSNETEKVLEPRLQPQSFQ